MNQFTVTHHLQIAFTGIETIRRIESDIGNKTDVYKRQVIDKLDPDSTASMQKDIAKGHESEIQGLLFDMIALGEKMDVDLSLIHILARKYGDQSFKQGEKDNLADAMADVLWVLICLANQTDVYKRQNSVFT